jgi:hypothetical protein
MKKTGNESGQFLQRWEERRKKKWLYIFLHGSVYRGLPMAIIMLLVFRKLEFENIQMSALLIYTIVFVLWGLWYGSWLFNQVDSMYLRLINNDDIIKGIETLKAGETWNYENLVIRNENNENLVVRNELFWFQDEDNSSARLNECINMVLADFQRLQKDKGFNDLTAGKKVKIQIFDNSGSDIPLIERTV